MKRNDQALLNTKSYLSGILECQRHPKIHESHCAYLMLDSYDSIGLVFIHPFHHDAIMYKEL